MCSVSDGIVHLTGGDFGVFLPVANGAISCTNGGIKFSVEQLVQGWVWGLQTENFVIV